MTTLIPIRKPHNALESFRNPPAVLEITPLIAEPQVLGFGNPDGVYDYLFTNHIETSGTVGAGTLSTTGLFVYSVPFTGLTNYERVSIIGPPIGQDFKINVEAGGTGVIRSLQLQASQLYFITGGTTRWQIASNGNISAFADAVYDIGASGSGRPRNVYVGNLLSVAGTAQFISAIQGNVGIQPGYNNGVWGAIFAGTGVPLNTIGVNGDFYFRNDTPATSLQRIYVKSAGVWVGIV